MSPQRSGSFPFHFRRFILLGSTSEVPPLFPPTPAVSPIAATARQCSESDGESKRAFRTPRSARPILSFWMAVALLPAALGMRAQQVREIVRLAMDFNSTAANGNPGGLLVSNNKLYFVGTDGTHGIELWRTDGTNVTRLTDLSYGSVNSFIGQPVEFDGELYFRGTGTTDGTINLELWKYDGTNASLVADINQGTGSGNPSG